MRDIAYFIGGIAIAVGIGILINPASKSEPEALGAPATEVTFHKSLIPLVDSLYDLGTSTIAWRTGYFDEVCLTADSCETSWPAGGPGGSIDGSGSASQLAYFTDSDTLSSVATGTLTTTATGLSLSATRYLVGGASILSLDSGYVVPTTTRLSTLDAFATTPSTVITAGTGIDWSGNTLNGVYTAGDGLTLNTEDFDCDTASGSVFGCLSTTDWSSFNSRELSDWQQVVAGVLSPTTTVGISVSASSTIGGGTGATGLTVNGTATSTNLKVTGLTSSRFACTGTDNLFTSTCTSAFLTGSLSDETGTGNAVFSAGPTFTATPVFSNLRVSTTGTTTLGYASTTALTVSGQTYLGLASTTGISGTNLNFTNSVITNATSSILAITSLFVKPYGTSPTVGPNGSSWIDSTSDQYKYVSNGLTKVLGNGNDYTTFTYATTTAWTGTTTLPLGPSYVAETWNGIQCFTDTGTLVVDVGDGTNFTNRNNASTTVGTTVFTTNNTFTAGEKRYFRVGTPASSPTIISCTISRSLTAD